MMHRRKLERGVYEVTTDHATYTVEADYSSRQGGWYVMLGTKVLHYAETKRACYHWLQTHEGITT